MRTRIIKAMNIKKMLAKPVPCTVCNKNYVRSRITSKYCSKRCSNIYFCQKNNKKEVERRKSTREHQPIICRGCEKVFIREKTIRREFCSDACQRQHYNDLCCVDRRAETRKKLSVLIECKYCKNKFLRKHNSSQIYCSRTCGFKESGDKKYALWTAAKVFVPREKYLRIPWNEKPITCLHCNKKFIRGRAPARFCSKWCCTKYSAIRQQARINASRHFLNQLTGKETT